MQLPTFELTDESCLLTAFNPRRELHGEDPVPAADLKFTTNMKASALAMFDPVLGAMLFHKSEHAASNLADATHEAPDLRFPKLKGPLDWDLEIVGAELTIAVGVRGKSDLVIPGCTVNKFQIDPQQGGQVIVSFRVQAHPDERQSGKLAFLIGQDVEVTLTPPKAAEDLAAAA